MPKGDGCPGVGERSGAQVGNRRQCSRGSPRRVVVGALALLVLLLEAACATGSPLGGGMAGRYRDRRLTSPAPLAANARVAKARAVGVAEDESAPSHTRDSVDIDAELSAAEGGEDASPAGDEGAGSRPRRQARRAGVADEAENWAGEGVGWPDGVGDGRPYAVPMSLDYFQGFLVRAGVPSSAVSVDGRTLSPQRALELLPHLLSTPVSLGNFGPRRMAAHLLLEVATGGAPVSRDELHARMSRFSRLLVVRPDGYLVEPTTGMAVQKVGAVLLADDGTLRAGRFEVGPFYAMQGGRLFPVDGMLEVPRGARSTGFYEPDDGVLLPVAEGAVGAVVDMVEGLYRLVFFTEEALDGLTQLPGVLRELYAHAPRPLDEFRHKPYAERVRNISRLATGAVLVVGTSGVGPAKKPSSGGRLGEISIPLLSLSGDGLLAVRLVAVPVGGAVAVAGNALSATYVLHMANGGLQGAGSPGGWPPIGGPGQWVEDTSNMSEQARAYQAQVTGAPRGWCYKICRGDICVDYDGFEPKTGTLLEAKAREYDKWFDADLKPRWNYEGLEGMVHQARRQSRLAGGLRLRWYVAEPRMVSILQKAFREARITGIEVVYTLPLP